MKVEDIEILVTKYHYWRADEPKLNGRTWMGAILDLDELFETIEMGLLRELNEA